MTLEEMCVHALARDASQPAIEYGKRWFSWGEMRRVAERVTGLIEESGADPRAPIAFMPRTRPSAAAALLGLIAKGRTVRMVYVFQSTAGLIRDIEVRKPAAVVGAATDFSDELIEGLRERGIAAIALEDMDANAVRGLEKSSAEADLNAPARHIETLTSGTTGAPKQFPLSYDMIGEHIVGKNLMFSGKGFAGSQQAPLLLAAPLGNISGIYGILPTTIRGHRVSLLDRFTVAGWHDYVLRYRPQIANMPAAGVQMVLDACIPREDLASIKTISTGAAPLDPTVQRAFEEHYGIAILSAYGATEFAGPVAAMTPELHAVWGKEKFGSVGKAVHGAQLRTIDPETGEVQSPGEQGILEVIAPRMGTHWIRTSDIVMIDADGFVFHRGRADGAIVRGGFKLLPETIERALLLHGAVSAAVVIGVADRRLGQVPVATIQLKPGAEQPTIGALQAHLRNHVLSTHIPTNWLFVADLPRTPSMKVDRPAVRRLVEASLSH